MALIDCMVFHVAFNSISVRSRWPVHLSMLCWSSFNQYCEQYSFQVCLLSHIIIFWTMDKGKRGMNPVAMTRKEYWPSSGIEPATSIYLKSFNPLPQMPILSSCNLAANKDMMSKKLTNGNTIFWLSGNHCGKRRNCSLRAISSFPTMFSKAVFWWCVKISIYGVGLSPGPTKSWVRMVLWWADNW